MTNDYYTKKFNETVNLQAKDPFLGTTKVYELWASKDRKSWIWLDTTTKEVRFLQEWDTKTKKHYAL